MVEDASVRKSKNQCNSYEIEPETMIPEPFEKIEVNENLGDSGSRDQQTKSVDNWQEIVGSHLKSNYFVFQRHMNNKEKTLPEKFSVEQEALWHSFDHFDNFSKLPKDKQKEIHQSLMDKALIEHI